MSSNSPNNSYSTTNSLIITLPRDPARILVKKERLTLDGIKQFYIPVNKTENKFQTLCELFSNLGSPHHLQLTHLEIAQCIIYCNKKEDVENLAAAMVKEEFVVSFMHEAMKQ